MTHASTDAALSSALSVAHPPTEAFEPIRDVPVHAPVHAPVHTSAQSFATAPVAARSGSGGLWVAVLAMACTAGAIWVIDRRLDEVGRANLRSESALQRQSGEVAALQRRLVIADAERGELEQRLVGRIGAERGELEQTLVDLREQSARVARGLGDVALGITALREAAGANELDRERRMSELAARIARNEEDQLLLVERLAGVEVASKTASSALPPVVAGGEPGRAAGTANGSAPGMPGASPTPPGWMALVAELANPNAGTRWEAVDGLGQTKDPLVIPHLVPMLADGDVFVRMATARVLGDLKAGAAVAPLIDALEDAEVAVREAALFALRAITGKDLRFDPLANEAERTKRIKAWREWWKKEQEASSASGDTPLRSY